MVWGFFVLVAVVLISLTLSWIARDHKKTTVKLATMPTPTVIARLDDAETMLDARMAELEDLKNQSLKKMKFDPTFVPPAAPATAVDAQAEELRKMTDRLQQKRKK